MPKNQQCPMYGQSLVPGVATLSCLPLRRLATRPQTSTRMNHVVFRTHTVAMTPATPSEIERQNSYGSERSYLGAFSVLFGFIIPDKFVWQASVLIIACMILVVVLSVAKRVRSKDRSQVPGHDTFTLPTAEAEGTSEAVDPESDYANTRTTNTTTSIPEAPDAPLSSVTPVTARGSGTKAAQDAPEELERFVPRIFISHSSADNGFGVRLTEELLLIFGNDNVWYDAMGGLKGGDRWRRRIVHEIDMCNVVILIISPEAMHSEWVHNEYELAFEQHKIIIPILHHLSTIPSDLAMIQRISFLPQRPFDESMADLVEAIRLGKTRWIGPSDKFRQPAGHIRIKPTGMPRSPLLIGRERESAKIKEAMRVRDKATVYALTGIGGIGKSALAAKVAEDLYQDRETFPGGVACIDCGGLVGAEGLALLWSNVARAVGYSVITTEQDPDARVQLLGYFLAERPRTLLVLDNVEPNLDASELITQLAIDGSTALLLTSRQRINANLDRQIELHLLSLQQGAELLTELMRRESDALEKDARPDEDDSPYIADIVRELDGLPLAIDLTAAHAVTQDLPLRELLNDLRASRLAVDFLAEPPDPRRALRACFLRSWYALSPGQQRLFAGLALFTGATLPRAGVLRLASTAMRLSVPEGKATASGFNPGSEILTVRTIQHNRLIQSIAALSSQLSHLFASSVHSSIAAPAPFHLPVSDLKPPTVPGEPEEIRILLQDLGEATTTDWMALAVPPIGFFDADVAHNFEVNFAHLDMRDERAARRALAAIIHASLVETVGRERLRIHTFLRDFAHEQFLTFSRMEQKQLGEVVLQYWLEFVKANTDEFGDLALQAEAVDLGAAVEWAQRNGFADAAKAIDAALTSSRSGHTRRRRHTNSHIRLEIQGIDNGFLTAAQRNAIKSSLRTQDSEASGANPTKPITQIIGP